MAANCSIHEAHKYAYVKILVAKSAGKISLKISMRKWEYIIKYLKVIEFGLYGTSATTL
jgi:hypothetical protein